MSVPKSLSDQSFINVPPDLIVLSKDSQILCYRIQFLCLSPYFQTVLRLNPLPDSEGFYRIDMKDVALLEVQQIHRYASCGQLEVSEDNVADLLVAADRYNIRGVINICEKFLSKKLSKTNFGDTYLLAHHYNCEQLKRSVDSYIRRNIQLDANSNQSNQEITVEAVLNYLANTANQMEVDFEADVESGL